MKVKKYKKLGIIASAAVLLIGSVLIIKSSGGFSIGVGGVTQWGHYDYVAPTETTPGSKEFWISCDAGHEISFVAPSGVEIIDRGAPSMAMIESMKEDGSDRYIYPNNGKLKFAIFADVQLTGKSDISGKSVTNQGSTANAPLALRNHLQYIKNQNIDVVLMNGDIANQANEYYYSYFNEILEDVYGSDESKYPEFVYNMGNHEWWGGITETASADAVRLFKENARIASPNLVHESNVKYSLDSSSTIPSYYKVINGVPFITISGVNAWSDISDDLLDELSLWLDEAKALSSVRHGGPIFIQYHCPISTSMTHGQGCSPEHSANLETLLKDTPQAIVFTGDTHFPGVNERAINQVNFTTINLGSSSYSRMVNASAVICGDYYNVTGSSSSKADKLVGNVKFKEAYTPTIQVVDVNADHSTDINRFFSLDGGNAKSVGKKWHIGPISSKSDFTYTNARFQNVNASHELYGSNGLSWASGDKVSFYVDENNRMTVRFMDVNEYHFCEHYKITVNDTNVYDVVSNYYKYLDSRTENYYVLDNVPSASSYKVSVTAYDFFDNPSLNTLTSTTNDEKAGIDPIDYQAIQTYCDIQTTNRFDDVSGEESRSSIEYYYRGQNPYKAGAILNRVYCVEKPSDVDCKDYLTLKNQTNVEPTLKVSVKNLNSSDLVFGITVVDDEGNWLSDFTSSYQINVSPGGWKDISWNLKTLFGFTCRADFKNIALKAKLKNSTSAGYEMNFLIDNLDIDISASPTPGRNLINFVSGENLNCPLAEPISAGGTLTIDFKFASNVGSAAIALLTDDNNYYGYFDIGGSTSSGTDNGVYIYSTDDGFIRVIFDLAKITKKNGSPGAISSVYLRGQWTTVSGQMDISPTKGEIVRGAKFVSGENYSKDLTAIALTETFTFDVKYTSGNDKHINVMLGDGWSVYFGYFELTPLTTAGAFNGLTSVTHLPDGFIRYTFKLSDITKMAGTPTKVNLFYIRGDWSNANGYVDVNPTI